MGETSVDFSLSQIGQIAVLVTDIDRAVLFYRDTLGMRLLFQAPPGLAFFDLNGIRLMLDGPAKAQAGNSSNSFSLCAGEVTRAQRRKQVEQRCRYIARLAALVPRRRDRPATD